MDSALFAYFEDLDFCQRARRAGWRIFCVPAARIWHKESASTKRGLKRGTVSAAKHYLMLRNGIIVAKRHATGWQRLAFFAIATPLRIAYFAMGFVVRGRWDKLRLLLLAGVDGIMGNTARRVI